MKILRTSRSILVLFVLPSCESLSLPSGRRVDTLGVAANVGAAVSAGAELIEDVESIGHGHGMLFLCCSKVCREINVMREAAESQVEDMHKKTSHESRLGRLLKRVLRLLTCRWASVTLAVAGLSAAFMEVLEDASPGGHHGAVFLALNELLELLETSRAAKGVVLGWIGNQMLRLSLVASAAVFALIETVGSSVGGTDLGAHHGVLILAISKTFRCIGKVRQQLAKKRA